MAAKLSSFLAKALLAGMVLAMVISFMTGSPDNAMPVFSQVTDAAVGSATEATSLLGGIVAVLVMTPSETAPLLQRELKGPCIHCEASNITAILTMAEAGLGVSLLPSLALERTGFELDVRHLRRLAHRVLYLVRRREVDLSLAARVFLAYL